MGSDTNESDRKSAGESRPSNEANETLKPLGNSTGQGLYIVTTYDEFFKELPSEQKIRRESATARD